MIYKEEFPLNLLYSSPPEAARLRKWLRNVKLKELIEDQIRQLTEGNYTDEWIDFFIIPEHTGRRKVKPYTTDISATKEAMEWMLSAVKDCHISISFTPDIKRWHCEFWTVHSGPNFQCYAYAPTMELAISRAVLLGAIKLAKK